MAQKERLQEKQDTRPRLTRATVVERALALADAEGPEALTIRRLARDLGVTPMALYWHFKSKEELLEGLVDRIIGEVDLSVEASAPWLEQFGAMVRSFVAALRAHPCAGALFTSSDLISEHSPQVLRTLETALDILRRAGFSAVEATEITLQSMRTAIAMVGSQPGFAPGLSLAEREQAERRTLALLELLPPDRYPRVREAAVPLSRCEDPDGYHEFGIDLLLAGIEAMARRRQR